MVVRPDFAKRGTDPIRRDGRFDMVPKYRPMVRGALERRSERRAPSARLPYLPCASPAGRLRALGRRRSLRG